VLSNPERRAHYDKYGTVMDDMESEDAFFEEFESMFMNGMGGGSDMFDDFEAFSSFLE
jgi:DnaJ-class molecular chaperone